MDKKTKEEIEEVIEDCEKAQVKTVEVEYSGSGDDGAIDSVTAKDKNGKEVSFGSEDAFSDLAYDVLESHYAGWEINDGSHGVITFTVHIHDGKINYEIAHDAYYTSTESSTASGEV